MSSVIGICGFRLNRDELSNINLEAEAGIEPTYTALQAAA